MLRLCNFKIKYIVNWLTNNCNALCNCAACLIRASACNAARIFPTRDAKCLSINIQIHRCLKKYSFNSLENTCDVGAIISDGSRKLKKSFIFLAGFMTCRTCVRNDTFTVRMRDNIRVPGPQA